MANFKKGIALALVATTAFTFAPVSTLGVPNAVVAEAADTVTLKVTGAGFNAEAAKAVTTGSITLAKGEYKLVADNDSERLTPTVATGDDNIPLAEQTDKKTYTTTLGEEFENVKFTFTDAKKGDNGVTNYTLIQTKKYVDDTTYSTNEEIAKFAVTLEKSTNGFTVDATGIDAKTDLAGNTHCELSLGNAALPFTAATKDAADAAADDKVNYKWTVDNGNVTLEDADKKAVKITAGSVGNVNVTVTATAKEAIEAVDGKNAAVAKGAVVAKKTFAFVVKASDKNISAVNTVNIQSGKTDYLDGYKGDADGSSLNQISLDTLVTKVAKLDVKAEGALTFVSADPSIATVSSDGVITAVKGGVVNIKIYAAPTATAKADQIDVPVVVSTTTTDVISTKLNGETVNDTDKAIQLDLSSSTAATAVKSAKIDATSAAGNAIVYSLVSGNRSTTVVAGNANDVVSVSADGTVTAGAKAGDAYILLQTKDNGNIKGANAWVKVTVNAKPAADLTVADVRLNMTTNKTGKIVATTDIANPIFTYDITADSDIKKGENKGVVTRLGDTLTAKAFGVATINVTVAETATTRATTKTAKVYVSTETDKKASDLTVDTTSVVAKVGETAELGAKATNPVTYAVADPEIAAVSETGVVTAIKAGQTTVTVSAAESDTMAAGTITVPVVVTEDAKPVVVAKPAKVKSVTGKAVKGGKVKFTAKKVANAAGYQFVYTSGKKTVKKLTSKNTLTVKIGKGKKTTVKVRAYNYKNGTAKQFGAFSAKKTVKASK